MQMNAIELGVLLFDSIFVEIVRIEIGFPEVFHDLGATCSLSGGTLKQVPVYRCFPRNTHLQNKIAILKK